MKKNKSSKHNLNNMVAEETVYTKRRETRLSTDFLGGIAMIIFTILVIVALAFMNATQKLDREIENKTQNLRESIAANLVSIISNKLEEDNSVIDATLATMIKSKLIAYCVITDSTDNTLLYSTIFEPKITNGKIAQSALARNAIKNTTEIKKKTDLFNMYIGFTEDLTFFERIKQLTNTIFIVFILCLALGIWLASGLCRRIIKPVKALIKTTEAFSNGDLSDRLERTKYIEFNELIDSYNGMADSIQRLYSSLEHQVQERTQQLQEAIKELQDTQAMMVHSEKMKSLGELVAGIMHEINNPINFIYGNMSHLKNYSSDLIMLIDTFEEYKNDLSPEHKEAYEKLLKEIDYDFLKEDLPDLIKSCHEGTERTKNIILNLKDFSRMEESAITNVDLPKEIDSTLNILNNKFKHGITVHKDYHDDVPKIEAYGGQLNQVFMNILDNAAFAVADKAKEGKGEVDITISKDENFAYIEIQDNGKGMTNETKEKIFNPFFTTKPVGQGTGLGLSISYKVIKNHKGTIDVQSELEKGTKFTIKLPLVFEQKQQTEKKEDIEVI
ncbi:MAG: sensor histidine kinase [Candidatus Gastranaerophilaceae bacterium]